MYVLTAKGFVVPASRAAFRAAAKLVGPTPKAIFVLMTLSEKAGGL